MVFSTQLGELLPLSPSFWFNSPPLPCVNKYTVYTYTVLCVRGDMGFYASDRYTPAAKSLYRSIFLDDDNFALPSLSIAFLTDVDKRLVPSC